MTAGWGPTVEVWRLLPLVDDSGASPIRASDIVAGPGKCPARPGDLRAESPDHTLVVTQSADRTTTLCRAADGSRVARARLTGSAGPADAVAVDAQGDVAVGDAEGFVTSYQRAGASFTTGRAIDVRLGGEPVHVTALAYHAGTIAAGIRPATTDEPARVFVWPVDTGGTPASFATDYMQVPAVALLGTSAEDLAVAGRDQDDGPVILQIWDTASRRRLGRSLSGLSGDVLALTGDETTVAAADSRGVAYRWELDRDPRRDICSIVGRPLTDAEWRTLAGGALGGFARDNVCGASPPTKANPPTTG